MRNQRSKVSNIVSYVCLLIGVAFWGYALAAKWLYVPGFKAAGYDFVAAQGTAGLVWFALWMGSFPLGMMFLLLGMGLHAAALKVRLLVSGVGLMVVVFAASMVQLRKNTPLFFGIGGLLIELCFLLLTYFWYQRRECLPDHKKLAIDVRFFGYALLGTGVWFCCGIGGMPIMTLYPEQMLAFGTHEGLVGLLSMIMIYFVLGWGLTALSYYLEARA